MKTKQPDFLDDGLVKQPATALATMAPPTVALTPLSVIQTAVQQGTDVDSMERLLAMYERSEDNRRRDAYNRAMSECQAEMPAVVRDKENAHLRTKYARLESVAKAIKPVYTKHGFSLSFGTLPDAKDDHCRMFCDCRHVDGHVERIEGNFPLDGAGAKGSSNKTGIQAMGSTMSYVRRYLALLIFNVSIEDEDTDGNSSADLIDENQVANLDAELMRMPPDDRHDAVDSLFKWAGIERLADLPVSKYQQAMAGLMKRSAKYNS